ncbi:hypothetical protein [Peterkaempfera bronchialis]|uniref:Uncharacterized protein n=1 Tax=Peterkaempfera bronchialis TaxID=2126346 RepID=A0A345SZB0_9ACTN|nr:hypothetical protein [Peterkaempfera bronchialis]AXI79065.1 hypothetical protein C7M71_018245 [Peterkaempfera bronchialis]
MPFVVRWSGERDALMPMVVRKGGRGIGYADERSFDRDGEGVLWTRVPSQPGKGTPEFGKVHTLRQRLCMAELRCQICGGPADRSPSGVLWLIDADPSELRPGDERTAHPPVCRPCAIRSTTACPHLRPAFTALRVRAFLPYGVTGALYAPARPMPVTVNAGQFRLGDPHLPWVRATQLLLTLTDFTVIDPDDPAA